MIPRLSGLLALMLVAGCAAPEQVGPAAAAPACVLPAVVTPAPAYAPPADEVEADAPTAFYMLALTWAPEDCRANGDRSGYEIQCRDNAFGFVLHGLWPNGEGRRHPRYCRPAPAISAATARRTACMTPSTVMQQHEWAAHGTCGWDSPEAYFGQAASLWESVKLPVLSEGEMTAGELRDAFVAANPWMIRDGIYIKTVDDNRLMDVRVCYDLSYRPMACKGSPGAGDATVLTITPRRPS
ncbi:MAG: ribonuclease T [Caulobacter sp.]|nr:ribonuclease T [Caulobacter sp.]